MQIENEMLIQNFIESNGPAGVAFPQITSLFCQSVGISIDLDSVQVDIVCLHSSIVHFTCSIRMISSCWLFFVVFFLFIQICIRYLYSNHVYFVDNA